MPSLQDGPSSPLFKPRSFAGNASLAALTKKGASRAMQDATAHALAGACTCWGIPFQADKPLCAKNKPVSVSLSPFKANWIVFLHTTDAVPLEWNDSGFITASRGIGRLNEHVADYVLEYTDGTEIRHAIRRRHQIGMFQRGMWGENNTQSVCHQKPFTIPPVHTQPFDALYGNRLGYYGMSQVRTHIPDYPQFAHWLWAWENPHPQKRIAGFRIEPRGWFVMVSGISAGSVRSLPLRWEPREKAVLKIPAGESFDFTLDGRGLLKQIALDLGQIISAQPRTVYPKKDWASTYSNQVPKRSETEVLVEYSAHPDARFHFNGKALAAEPLSKGRRTGALAPIAPARQRVSIRVVEKSTKKPVPVKLHIHGEAGEYLAPVDRHRIPNPAWFEDYSVDYLNQDVHYCTYVPGETTVDLPLGNVYIEISKGFEIRPIRKVVKISRKTTEITFTLDKVLPWRERGWVTADTHVHFVSPIAARLEGSAEGVNVVNLLASQWGDLMTNVGDFDGETTHGSVETGGDGEWLVRVGTENRQHVLGHISLLGYSGSIIAPMCVGGPDESAIGDPVGILMAEWARQCRKQGGLVVMPHFPNPRLENAANLISGDVDAIEMCSWGDLYGGIDPYSLSDWYRYLNCGYFYPAVGGTDKMAASTAIGALRTYTHLGRNREFTYENWMTAVRRGNTFITYGPLLEFSVEGKPAGTSITMKRTGGKVDVEWKVASVTIPMSKVELVINGEIRESRNVNPRHAQGQWSVKLDRSSWVALLVRGHYPDKPEIIAAHSSPVMVRVEGTPFFAAADAVTILDQIEGALAYIDTVGTRADTKTYKRMRMILTAAHRRLHNELHRHGHYHEHTHTHDHHKK